MEAKPTLPKSSSTPALKQDLYPTLDQVEISPATQRAMRASHMNPTQLVERFNQAHASKDYAAKATIVQQLGYLEDQVNGGSAATNYFDSHRLRSQAEAQPRYNSVSTKQAIGGTIYNGFLEMAEGLAKLPVVGAGLTGAISKQSFKTANDAVSKTFDGWKAYVSEDWQKPMVAYDDENGVQFDLNIKSIIGTASTAATYILPGLLTGGVASLATIAERKALQVGASAAERALISQTLSKVGKVATVATGAEAFLQTFPSYQREALANGLDIHDASLWGLVVGGTNAAIETASMGALTQALGISAKAAKATVRQVGIDEATKALQSLAMQELTPKLLMETAEGAARNTLGVIGRHQELTGISRLLTGIGGRLKRGFLEQGLSEGGEEVLQSLVENASKQVYNNLADSDSTGRFKDPSVGKYVFDSIYGGLMGAVIGTPGGVAFNSRPADPTVFGYVGANVRQGLRKNYELTDMLSDDPANPARLKMLGVLDFKLRSGEIDGPTHADLTEKVHRMAQVAQTFTGVDQFGEADRNTMWAISDARHGVTQADAALSQASQQYEQLNQQVADPTLSEADRLRAQFERGKVEQTLGGLVDAPDGNGMVFQAQANQGQRAAAVEHVVSQAMKLYADDNARPAINTFVTDNLEQIKRQYDSVSYDDDFKPAKLITDASTGKLLVADSSQSRLRQLSRTGGQIRRPAGVDEVGGYIPSERTKRVDMYGTPVDSLDQFMAIHTALADKSSPVEATDYRKPDNSTEGAWLADGRDLVQQIGELSALRDVQSEKKRRKSAPKDSAELKQAKSVAAAYLQSSGFLETNPAYADEYAEVAANLQAALGPEFLTSEQDAQPIGEDVSLLDGIPVSESGLTDAEYTDFVDNNQVSPERLQAIAEKIQRGEAITDPRELAIFNGKTSEIEQLLVPIAQANEQTTPNARPVPIAPDLGAATLQPPAPQPDFADELQFATQQEHRRDAGVELQGAASELADAVRTLSANDQQSVERLFDAVIGANNALESELAAYEEPVEQRPTDQSAAGAGRSRSSKPKVASFAQSFVPVDVQSGILSYFARRNKINQADFDRVAGEAMRRGGRGGNPFLNYLDPANRQPPLDTIGRGIADSLGLTDYDQQTVEQAIVEAVTGFTKGNGPSQQLKDRYTETEQQQTEATAEAALEDAVASLDLADQSIVAENPSLYGFASEQTNTLYSAYTPEEVTQLAESLLRHGYIDEDGVIDIEQFIQAAPAIESGLLDFDPAGMALYQKLRESLIFDPTEVQALYDGIDAQSNRPQESAANRTNSDSGAGIETGDLTSEAAPADHTGPAIESSAEGQSEGTITGTPTDSRADEQRLLTVRGEIANTAVSDARTSAIAAPYDIAIASEQKTQLAIQRRIDRLTDGIYEVPNSNAALRIENGEAVEAGTYNHQTGTFTPNGASLTAKGTATYADVQTLKKEQKQLSRHQQAIDVSTQKVNQLQQEKLQAIENAVFGERQTNPSEEAVTHEAPLFQLAQSENSTPIGNLASSLSASFGVEVMADQDAYNQALEESGAPARTGNRVPNGFYYKGKVYLNPATATASTVLEEFSHAWNALTRTSNPELYARGVALAKESKYFKQLQADPYYRALSVAQLEDEALAQAVADKGEQFVTDSRKTSFRQWLSELWNFIKQKLGISPSVDLGSMSLDDYARMVVNQLQSGQLKASSASDGIQFQLPQTQVLGATARTAEGWRDLAEEYYQNPPSFNLKSAGALGKQAFTGVSPDLMARSANQLTAADKAFIKEVTKQTGWKLVGAGELHFAKDAQDGIKAYHPNAYHTADGQLVRLESNQVGSILGDFDALYTDAAKQPSLLNRGRVFKTMFDTMSRWATLETYVGWIDDKAGTLKQLITDVRRTDQRKADYVDNKLQPLLEDLRQKMAPFTAGWKGKLEVPTIPLSIYEVAGNGIAQKEIKLPVAQAMALVRQVETQKSSGYAALTTVWNQPPSVDQLVRRNTDGSVSKVPRGAVYYDELTDQTHYINIDAAQYEALRSRFVEGGGLTGETQAYQAIVDLFNNPIAKQMLAQQNGLLRPDEPFADVADYYPLDTFTNMDARQRSRQAGRTLDENKRLLSRSGAAQALLLQDPLITATSYLNAVRDVLASGRLVDNLNTLQTQLANDYQGKKKEAILSYLGKMSQDLKDHRAKLAERRAEGGLGVLVDAATRRYTNSVFSWNIGIPLKQTGTYAAALGQGIIDNIHLTSSEALGTLARLTGGAYLNQDAPSTVNPETGRGFSGKLTGKTQDADLLRELMGLDIADEAEREAYQQRAATIIARATFQQSLYTGDVE